MKFKPGDMLIDCTVVNSNVALFAYYENYGEFDCVVELCEPYQGKGVRYKTSRLWHYYGRHVLIEMI